MKIMKCLLAASVVAAGSHAYATCYSVTGAMTGISTVGASITPSLYVHAGTSTSYDTSASVFPSFTGTWCISTSPTAGISGDITIGPYATSISAGVTAVVTQPNPVYNFNSSGTPNWTAGSGSGGTLTYGDALTMTGGNSQTSDGSLTFNGTSGSCSGSSLICNSQTTYFVNHPDLELVYVTLTVAPDGLSISGSIVGADVGGGSGLTKTGNTWYSYTFTGH